MAGRPTPYRKEYDTQAEKLCKLGATDKEIADFFGVHVDTIHEWKNKHPEFSDSIKKGKLLADSEVAEKLFKRATGYSHPDVDIRVIDGQIVETELVKHYPPDTPAAIFWLKNRRKKEWRDKIETGFTNGDGDDVQVVTVFELPNNGRNAIQDNQAAAGLSNEGA